MMVSSRDHYGIEFGIESKISSTVKASGGVAFGEYVYTNNPGQSGTGAPAVVRPTIGGGSDGIHTFIGTASNVQNTYTYQPSTTLQVVTLQTTSKFTEITLELAAGGGADSQQGPGASGNYSGVIGGKGYGGAKMNLELKDPDDQQAYVFKIQPGYGGQSWSGGNGDGTGGAGGQGWNNSSGGRGGDGATDDGGGGGGATAVFLQVNANEEGVVYYDLYKQDETTYVFLERYKDQEAQEAHGKTDYFRELGAKMGAFMAGAPDIKVLQSV